MSRVAEVVEDTAVDPQDVAVVVCIGVDGPSRERLATVVDGTGVLMFAPDLETAHAMLGRQIELEHAVATKEAQTPEAVVRMGDLEVDRRQCQVRWRQEPVTLSQRERDLLALLASEPARAWSHEQLYRCAWDDEFLDTVPVHAAVKRLRRKLRAAGVPFRVESVRGVGYQLLSGDGGGRSPSPDPSRPRQV